MFVVGCGVALTKKCASFVLNTLIDDYCCMLVERLWLLAIFSD